MTNACAWYTVALRPQKSRGSLGRGTQDGHLDFHTGPELWSNSSENTNGLFSQAILRSSTGAAYIDLENNVPSGGLLSAKRHEREIPPYTSVLRLRLV